MNEYLKRNTGGTNKKELETFRKCLDVAIDRLKPRQKEILKMYYYENMDGVQIAKDLGISQPAVSKSLNKSVAEILKYVTVVLQFLN